MAELVQIAISVYRQRTHFIKKCVLSALRQSLASKTIHLRTDGHHACSAQALKWIRRVTKQNSEMFLVEGIRRIGIYNSYNAIFHQSESKYILQLDADDFIHEHALDVLVEQLEGCPDAVMAFGECVEVDSIGRPIRMRNGPLHNQRKELLTDFYCFHPRLIRRTAFESVGGFSPGFDLAGDYDLCLRLNEIGAFCHVNLPLYFHRDHVKSASRTHSYRLNEESLLAVTNAIERRSLSGQIEATSDLMTGSITIRDKSAPPPGLFYIVPSEAD